MTTSDLARPDGPAAGLHRLDRDELRAEQLRTLADLFRQVGFDERIHKLESEAHMSEPRFR